MTKKLTPSSTSPTTEGKLYFGYGSNLSLTQMRQRCPSSSFTGLGRLRGFRWIINARGYANVITAGENDEVWGMIYRLSAEDEELLDVNEGVPFSYTKEMHAIDFWSAGAKSERIDAGGKSAKWDMLVYVDRRRIEEAEPKSEYVLRMNRGIEDALVYGVPGEYVENVMRRFIPASKEEDVDAETRELAERQAVGFREESDVVNQ